MKKGREEYRIKGRREGKGREGSNYRKGKGSEEGERTIREGKGRETTEGKGKKGKGRIRRGNREWKRKG